MKALLFSLILLTQFVYADTTHEVLPIADTYVTSEQEQRNFGTESLLDLKTYYAGTRLLIKFDKNEIANLLANKDLVSARLELPIQNHYVKVEGQIGLFKMNVDWTETGATWKCPNQSCSTPWLMWSHDPNNTIPYPYDLSPFTTGTIVGAQAVPVGFNLEGYVNDLISGNIANNYGFAVFKISTNINDPLAFYSRESDVGPKLILTVKDKAPVSTSVIASLSASVLSGTAPLAVHFDASASKAKTGSSIQKIELDIGNGFRELNKLAPTLDFTFTAEGEFQGILKVTDASGDVVYDVVNISVLGGENNNLDANYGYWINFPSNLNVKYNNGQTAQISGDICKIWKTQNKDGSCQWVDGQKLQIKAFFPDMTREVSSNLAVTATNNKRSFNFSSPALSKDSLNVFTVVIGEIDPQTVQYGALKAKIEMRILVLDQKIIDYQNQGIDETVLKALRDVRTNLVSLCDKIDKRNAKVPSVLAQYNLPLQIDNRVSSSRYYSTMVGGFRFELSSDIGNLYQGDYPNIKSRVTNINYISDNTSDLEGYNFKYSYKNAALTTMLKPSFLKGAVQEYTFQDTSHSNLTDFYSFGVVIEEKFKWWARNLGSTEFAMPVMADTAVPNWANPNAEVLYTTQLPIFTEKAVDTFGRLNRASFKALVTGQVSADITDKFSFDSTSGGTDYTVRADLRNLYSAEGYYELSYTMSDFEGHKALPETFIRKYHVDRTAPFIMLPYINPFTTNDEEFPLPITIADRSNFHLKVFVNGIKQIDENIINNDNYSSEQNVTLNEGLNLIRVEATDAVGNITTINYPGIMLDTILPTLTQSNLTEGQVVRTADYIFNATASEPLKEVLVNGESLNITSGATGFSKKISHASAGDQTLEVTLKDLIGNTRVITYHYKVQLNILRIELVGVSPTADGKLQVVGSVGAADPGITMEVNGGFFNTETITASEDGSFIAILDPFTTAEIKANDFVNNIEEVYPLTFNANTTLSGVIKDPHDEPLPGVTVTIVSSGQTATTDLQGVFHIPSPVLGDQKIIVDGKTIPENYTQGLKEFSSVALNVSIGKLQQNILERTIYISPKLLDGTETLIQPNTAATIESVHAPGVSLEVPANAVTFPAGVESTSINMMEIDAKKTSVELPEGVEPSTVVALEPSGLKFKEPVKLVLPNNNDFPEGIELVIMSKNSTTGLWEVDGSATVVNNQIETKPGQGITHFSEVFAAPFGMEMTALGPKDKPGIENSIGDLTTSVSLPAYKRLGNTIEPKLIYKSSWAHPTAVVSNVFKIPKKDYEFSGSLSQGNWAGSTKIKETIHTWLIPDSIETQFFVNDIASERITFEADSAPENAVVSYAVDLSSMKSGVYPASAEYEIKYRNLVLRTTKIKQKSLFSSKTKVETVVDKDVIESIFPPDLRTLVFHQNKIQSEFGSGWKFAANQQIINPGEDRIMIENADGSVSSYTVKNSVETIYTDAKDLDSAYLSGDSIVVKDIENNVKRIDGATGNLIRKLPNYTGILGVNLETHWRYDSNHHVLRCSSYQAGYDVPRKVNNLFPLGNQLVYSDSLGAILNVVDDSSVAGTFKAFETLESVNSGEYQPHCRAYLAADCGAPTVGESFYYILKPYTDGNEAPGDCTKPAYCYRAGNAGCRSSRVESTGLLPSIGYSTGAATQSKLNNPIAITAGQGSNTIVVADSGNNIVRKINLGTNAITNIAGNQQTYDNGDGGQATEASIYHPRGLAYDVNGNMYISTENGYIRKVSASGIISTIAGKPLTQGGVLVEIGNAKTFNLKTPSDMVVDNENGYLYVADTGNHRIVQIDLIEGEARSVAGNGTCVTGAVKEGTTALATSICNPVHIGLDTNKNLIYLDKTNRRVRKVIFSDNTNGIQRFASSVLDNSELIKNADGSYVRTQRSGVTDNFNSLGLHLRSSSLDGLVYQYAYNNDKQLTSITDPTGSTSSLQYSGDKLASFTDAANRTTQFHYEGDRLIEVAFADGTSKQFSYNGDNLLTQEINQRGYATQYGYNVWNRISFVKSPDNSVIQLEDYQSRTFANSFDGSTRKLVNYTDGKADDLSDSIKNAKSAETVFVRDTNGYASKIIDADGKLTTIERDADGRPTKITKPDATYTTFTYSTTTGDLLSRYESSTNTTETFVYNDRGQLTSHKDHANRIATNSYDTQTGRLLSETDSSNLSTTRTYGTYGLIASITNPLSQTQRYEYDNAGNLSKVISPMGEAVNYTRDLVGNLVSKTNAKNQVTNYSYDLFNRLLSVKTPGDFTTTYSYLESGELTEIVNPLGFSTRFEYDVMGRIVKKTSPIGQVTQLAYDSNGNVTQETDAKGQVETFEYNMLDQLVRKVLPDNVYTFTYTDAGNVKTIADDDSQFEYDYTQIHGSEVGSGVTQNVLDIPQYSLNYSLDILGRRTRLISSYMSVDYTYGLAGQILSVKNDKNESFSFGYDNGYKLTSMTRSSGIVTNYGFDANSFLTSVISKKGSNQTLNNFSYQRDAINNRTSMTTSSGTHSYLYDQENQIVSASHPEGDQLSALESFTYDPLGNRLSDVAGSYDYGGKSYRLEQDYKYLYAYDLNGNLVTRQEKGMTGKLMNFSYSSENQVVGIDIIENGAVIRSVEYFYDALGRRTQKRIVENSTEKVRKYIYDGSEIIAELNNNNNILARYTQSGLRTDDTLAMDVTGAGVTEGIAPNSGTYHFLKDGLGSVIDITDSSGSIVQHYSYSSFGKILKITSGGIDSTESPLIKTGFSFTNREYDFESGLYYYRARYYDAHSGRFLQKDSHPGLLGSPLSINAPYGYGLNNPVLNKDPSGRIVPLLIAAAVSGLIAASFQAGSMHGNFLDNLFSREALTAFAVSAGTTVATFGIGWGVGYLAGAAGFSATTAQLLGALAGGILGGAVGAGMAPDGSKGLGFLFGFTSGAIGGFQGAGSGYNFFLKSNSIPTSDLPLPAGNTSNLPLANPDPADKCLADAAARGIIITNPESFRLEACQ
jgi:RHS repeat-associated protein